MTTKTTSNLLESLRAASKTIMANSNVVHQHGDRFFLVVTGSEVIDGRMFLVGNEPFRGLENIRIHVKDPLNDTVMRGNEVINLRKFSQLVDTGAVRKDDMVVFKDVAPINGTDNVYVAHGYETPFNNIQSDEVVKSTSVNVGYMSIEGKEHPQIVLYQNNPSMVGTLEELQKLPTEERKTLLIDGQFMANLRTEDDLVAWAQTQFALKRPVTLRAIVKAEDGQHQSVGVKVNPTTIEQTNEADQKVYRVHSVESSMETFFNSKEVQEIIKLLRIAVQGNFNVDTFDKGGQIMIEGIPTLRVNDAYRNVADEYARSNQNVFQRVSVALDSNRVVMQNVALQAVLITKNYVVNTPTGARETIRVGNGSGLLENATEAYMLSELPTPNFLPSANMGTRRDHDQIIGANRSIRDDEIFRVLSKSFGHDNAEDHAVVEQQAPVQQAPVQQTQEQQAPVQAPRDVAPVAVQTQQIQPQDIPVPPLDSMDDDFGSIDIVDDAVGEDDLLAALHGLSGNTP